MTKIISRYFASVDDARAAKQELIHRQRFSPKILELFRPADDLATALEKRNVDATTAKTYEAKIAASGGAILLVKAGYKPLGVAKIFKETAADMGGAALADLTEEVFIRDEPNLTMNVMKDHPLFLTRHRDPDSTNHHMADWPIPLISRNRPSMGSLIPPHARMADWPIPLLSDRKPFTGSIIGRHSRMANFPIGLISRRKPFTGSIFPRHARMAAFPIPLISRRKPYTGTRIGRHPRMANWPFPHLINGQTGTNALVPGGKRMANFPIRLISRRKPFTASILPRHARMAAFPIRLISKRKPFTGSIVPRHGRMANAFLPLTIPHGATDAKGFSLSKLLGLPTVVSR